MKTIIRLLEIKMMLSLGQDSPCVLMSWVSGLRGTLARACRRRATVWLCVTLGCAATSHAAERKPNFLFIYTDDQRWDAMGVVQREQAGHARFPWFKSPNMDRLAGSGVRFRNAFATCSLCAPSRAAFLTGCYNHLNGITNNHTEFPVDTVTHASLLRAAGYTTAYIGKWHMGEPVSYTHLTLPTILRV